jgi:hypothetical protein
MLTEARMQRDNFMIGSFLNLRCLWSSSPHIIGKFHQKLVIYENYVYEI